MNIIHKKHLILLFSLLLAIISICKNIVFAEKPKNKPVSGSHINNDSITKVINNNSWINICKYWKKLNTLESKSDYNKNYKMMDSFESEFENIKKDLNNLKNEGLIDQDQKGYLINLINERLAYLRYSLYLIKCYQASEIGTQITNSRKDLETRYDTLQKLFAENKISSKTFETTSNQIKQDLDFIDSNSEKQAILNDKKLLNLIIYLNK
ncbi:MAG: hypothetical protein AB1782_18995 [Cyanobacteriota bacterium]